MDQLQFKFNEDLSRKKQKHHEKSSLLLSQIEELKSQLDDHKT